MFFINPKVLAYYHLVYIANFVMAKMKDEPRTKIVACLGDELHCMRFNNGDLKNPLVIYTVIGNIQ